MLKKIILAVLLVSLIPLYLVFNRPLELTIPSTYEEGEIGRLIDEPFLTSTRNVLGYQLVAENNFLKLFLNLNTTQFAVVDKRNDHIWYSSVFTTDTSATETVRRLQKSTFAVRYLETDNTTKYITNYEYSILSKTFEIDLESVENGFRIDYTLKDSVPKGYWLPTKIAKDRFIEKVLTPFQNYDFTPEDDFSYQQMLRVLNNYYRPMEDDPETYQITVIQQGMDTTSLGRIETEELFYLFYVIGTYGNIQDDVGVYQEEYNLDDVNDDNLQYEINIDISDPEFLIPMEIRLMDDHVDAQIVFDEVVQKDPYEITSIQFLPYMAAANESRTGYLVIPEGSGGIIRFNNGKTRQRSYSTYFYGKDQTTIPTMLTLSDLEARLPIFGLKHENNAVLAVVENGQTHAMLTAEISGKTDRFNKAYTEFTFKDSGLYYLTQQGVSIWNPDQYDYRPQIKYYFLAQEEADYGGMARLYGKYLEQKYRLKTQIDLRPELNLDILGSFDADEYFLFFPYKKVDALTDYAEALTMVQHFESSGVDSMVVNFKGWFNNGMNHERANAIHLDPSVGTRRDMDAFVAGMNSHSLYFDVNFVTLYDRPALYPNRNFSRIVGGTVNEMYPYDIATRLPDKTKEPIYLLKIQTMYDTMDSFLSDFGKLDATGLHLRQLGQQINSDFHRERSLYRYQMVGYIQSMLEMVDREQAILLEYPNDYALPFASHLIDIPYQTSNYLMVDQAIPFYQIAIAGKIAYAMPSININQIYGFDYYLLKALETGSNPKFTLSYRDTSLLIETNYNTYFSTEFDRLKNDVTDLFLTYQEIIGNDNYLVDHEIIAPGKVRVTYRNGLTIDIDYENGTYVVL